MNKYKRILILSIFLPSLLVLSLNLFSGQALAVSTTQYRQADAVWKSASGAIKYHVYYKEKGAMKYQHAVGNLPSSSARVTIGGLKIGTVYVYNVSAVNDQGKEFWWSGDKPL